MTVRKQICRIIKISVVTESLFLLVGCSGISATQISQQTGIPEQSIRAAAECTYTATDAGKRSDSASRGIFILNDESIRIYNATDASTISGAPIYQLKFHELDSVALASYGLVRQLQFYQGNRVLAVILWNQFDFSDNEKAAQIHDYMTKHGLNSRANCEVIMLGTSSLTY